MPTSPGLKETKTSVQLPSGVNYNITEPLVYGPRHLWKRFGWKANGKDDESGAAHAKGENISRKK